ncbi:MAG: ribosomal protein S18-alanine N-acetyltransferase [Actinobacteria bacterium]|nr:ribosomal protein S18-alanine N-acetyltransferase [Actinomycetota bacterium]
MNGSSGFSIEPMMKDDLNEVAEMESRIFPSPWTRSQFKAEISNPFCHYMVAKMAGKVIGYVGFVGVEDEGYITNIAVEHGYRRKGVGTLLITHVFEKAIELGVKKLLLDVRRSNTNAQRFYRRFGFAEVSVRRRYYSDNLEDAIVMASEMSSDSNAMELIENIRKNMIRDRGTDPGA